jgi:hypothetical protein
MEDSDTLGINLNGPEEKEAKQENEIKDENERS